MNGIYKCNSGFDLLRRGYTFSLDLDGLYDESFLHAYHRRLHSNKSAGSHWKHSLLMVDKLRTISLHLKPDIPTKSAVTHGAILQTGFNLRRVLNIDSHTDTWSYSESLCTEACWGWVLLRRGSTIIHLDPNVSIDFLDIVDDAVCKIGPFADALFVCASPGYLSTEPLAHAVAAAEKILHVPRLHIQVGRWMGRRGVDKKDRLVFWSEYRRMNEYLDRPSPTEP